MHKATQYGDPNQLVNAGLKYSPRSACIVKIAHMEGEEIFRSYKQKANLGLGLEGDSHKHNLGRIKFREMLRSLKLHVEMEFGI
jgi:hypothetical protein